MIESWLEQYGYFALLIGGMLEGEAAFIAAGYLVSQAYLDPLLAYLVAVAGGCLGDNLYYRLGRHYGGRLIRSFPRLRRLRARAILLLRRWGRAAAFLTRFAYGLRVVLPITIGATRFPPLRFFLFNLLGSATFAALYLGLGYLFGSAVGGLREQLRGYEVTLILAILALGLVAWAAREWWLLHTAPEEE